MKTIFAALLLTSTFVGCVGHYQHGAFLERSAGCTMVERGLGLTDRYECPTGTKWIKRG